MDFKSAVCSTSLIKLWKMTFFSHDPKFVISFMDQI